MTSFVFCRRSVRFEERVEGVPGTSPQDARTKRCRRHSKQKGGTADRCVRGMSTPRLTHQPTESLS